MGVNQKRIKTFQGRVDRQAVARAHKSVSSQSAQCYRAALSSSSVEKMNMGPALGTGKEGVEST